MPVQNISTDMRKDVDDVLDVLIEALPQVVRGTDHRMALPPGAEAALATLDEPLPTRGDGSVAAIERLLDLSERAGGNTAGPKCFHFVLGGSTPAAQAADVLATAYDAMAGTWLLSPVGVQMERQALDWLKELFQLPRDWPGVMVTGATMANVSCLAAARQWWGDQLGVDVSETGLAGLPQLPVLTSGFVHASVRKALAMLGVGRGNLRAFATDEWGHVDLSAMAAALDELDGRPAVVIANAGEVNAGEFDPISDMIDLARQHNCWVHVDGAFGMFARVSPRTSHLAEGVERADSITVDGHKWLNVPYDSGYAFVRDHGLMSRAFRFSAAYLPAEDDPRPSPSGIGPESSRRARSFAVWATLKAYGRDGTRQIVEHCLDLAQYLAQQVEGAADLELMQRPELNIVPFRFNPGGLGDDELDELNQRLGEKVIADGRFLVGTSRLGPRVVFRPAFSNWRTRREDVDEFVAVIQELGRS